MHTRYKQEQLLAIKNRLIKKFSYYHQNGLSINKLKEELNNMCGFELNYDTLAHTLDLNRNTLDMYCVIAMCRYFNLDIAYVLSEPSSTSEAMDEQSQFISERYSVLNDPRYMGTYYGYLYSQKQTYNLVDKFELDIHLTHGKVLATLTVIYYNEEKTEIGRRKFTGIPIFVRPSNIYIVFTESNGQFILMSFSYVHYNVKNLYFRRGAIITLGKDAARQPLLQSFVLFGRELSDEQVEKYVPGFLLLYDSAFHIRADVLAQLAEEHEDVAYLFRDFSYIFQANCERFFTVNEAQILASVKNNMPKKDVIKALQIMKSNAVDAKRIYFPEIEAISEFAECLINGES